MTKLLEVAALTAGYGDLTVLREVTISVKAGELLAVIGANGAGKTTLLRTVAGFLRPTAGEILFMGKPVGGLLPFKLARRGLALVGERSVLNRLSVYDNLVLGAYSKRARPLMKESLEEVFTWFPVLAEKRRQDAGLLSGGQQQMLCIGRALMAKPSLLMLDEPSAGLSPLMATGIFNALTSLVARGLAVLLVEQNVAQTLKIASRAYVLESGRVVIEGSGKELANDPRVKVAYLGL